MPDVGRFIASVLGRSDQYDFNKKCENAKYVKQKSADSLSFIPKIKTDPWDHQIQAFWFVVELWGGLPDGRNNSNTSS